MPANEVKVANMALAHCGVAGSIQDLENESSEEAIQCRLFLGHCRELMLEQQPWGFAQRRMTLAQLSNPPSAWKYRYQYPTFCARVNKIINPVTRTPNRDQQIPFEIEDASSDGSDGSNTEYGRVILTDQANAQMLYNHKIEDLNLFTTTAIQALSLLLATHIAPPLRVKANLTELMQQFYSVWNSEAASLSLGEPQPDQEVESQFVNVRG